MAKGGETSVFELVAIEEVVGVKGNEAAMGMDDRDTGLFDGADVEGIRVEEMDNENAEGILVAEIGGSGEADSFRALAGIAADEFTASENVALHGAFHIFFRRTRLEIQLRVKGVKFKEVAMNFS